MLKESYIKHFHIKVNKSNRLFIFLQMTIINMTHFLHDIFIIPAYNNNSYEIIQANLQKIKVMGKFE